MRYTAFFNSVVALSHSTIEPNLAQGVPFLRYQGNFNY